jgi:hypothetical protein
MANEGALFHCWKYTSTHKTRYLIIKDHQEKVANNDRHYQWQPQAESDVQKYVCTYTHTHVRTYAVCVCVHVCMYLWQGAPLVFNRPDHWAGTTVARSTGTLRRCRAEEPELAELFFFASFEQDRQSLSYYSFSELRIQDRKFAYNMTLSCDRATIFSVGKFNILSVYL